MGSACSRISAYCVLLFLFRDGWSWFGMAELRGLFRFSDIPGQQLLGQWLSGPGQPVFAQASGGQK